MNTAETYIRNLVGGLMCLIGFGMAGLVTFFVSIGIIWGYATRPTFSPDIGAIFVFIVLIGLLIGGIGVRISAMGGKKQSVVIMGDDAIVTESDD